MGFDEVERVAASGLADAIPLHVGFRAGPHPIVGTELAYFSWRDLGVASGRLPASLGECVLGAEAARSLGVEPGDAVVSSPDAKAGNSSKIKRTASTCASRGRSER